VGTCLAHSGRASFSTGFISVQLFHVFFYSACRNSMNIKQLQVVVLKAPEGGGRIIRQLYFAPRNDD
jgi:hypothetical protein